MHLRLVLEGDATLLLVQPSDLDGLHSRCSSNLVARHLRQQQPPQLPVQQQPGRAPPAPPAPAPVPAPAQQHAQQQPGGTPT